MPQTARIDIEVLEEFLFVKGYSDPRKALEETFGFTKVQVTSYFSSSRRPPPDAAIALADRLEVDLSYLCRLPVLGYVGLMAAQVAARASLERFIRDEPTVPMAARVIFEEYAMESGAPRRVSEWRALYERFFVPAARFGQQQQKEVSQMLRRHLAREQRAAPEPQSPPTKPPR
jgi:hypothetical protein